MHHSVLLLKVRAAHINLMIIMQWPFHQCDRWCIHVRSLVFLLLCPPSC